MFAQVRRPANTLPSSPRIFPGSVPAFMLHAFYHVLLYALWCLTPAAVLIPLRALDREPRNEVTHESGDDEPDGERLAA